MSEFLERLKQRKLVQWAIAYVAGDAGRAIATLGRLLSTPGGARFRIPLPLTPGLLRLDPMFDPLRNDSRFQKLCQEK
jgi:hypothetical protein